jgi:hypothetical protein
MGRRDSEGGRLIFGNRRKRRERRNARFVLGSIAFFVGFVIFCSTFNKIGIWEQKETKGTKQFARPALHFFFASFASFCSKIYRSTVSQKHSPGRTQKAGV